MSNQNDILFNLTKPQNSLIRLEQEITRQYLKALGAGWAINSDGRLFREYKFSNFLKAMNFANRIASIAEQENHHPNLYISWGVCSVEIWTHTLNGLTENDFILAYKISELKNDHPK